MNHSLAAIMRIGLIEMKSFCMEFFTDVKPDTFLQESAGVADLVSSCPSHESYFTRGSCLDFSYFQITSCLGGRNRFVWFHI